MVACRDASPRLAASISVLAALLAVPAGAQAANVVRPTSVSASAIVPPGGTQHAPPPVPGSVGGAERAPSSGRGPGVTVRRSIPGSGAGDWSFRVAVADGAGAA